jgi:rhamnose utilization protein RhaD (predicted bifunctional aldolase and dehydrogenase)
MLTGLLVEQSLSELIQLSRSLGSDARLVWAGGGNISVKDGAGGILIKASGTELGRMTRTQGWRKVNLNQVLGLLDNLLGHKVNAVRIKNGLQESCCDTLVNAPMPSIETFFHALLGRCVVHLHPVAVLPYLCSKNGYNQLKKSLSPKYDFHWIEFRGLGVVTAGQILRKILKNKLKLFSRTHIFFLSNHGLIVSCQSAEQAKTIVHQIVNCCEKKLSPTVMLRTAEKNRMTKTAANIQSACNLCCDGLANRITVPVKPLRTPEGLTPQKAWFEGIITPEELTYLHAGILWLQNDHPDTLGKSIKSHFRKTGLWPAAFYVARQGLFVSESKENLSLYQKVFTSYLQIRGRAMHLGGLRPLALKYLSGEGL